MSDTDKRPIPSQISDCSTSAKAVYLVLTADGPLTKCDLADALEVNPRSVEYPLDQLRDAGVLVEYRDTEDGRRNRYAVDA